MTRIAVLGAGPAGLGAAWQLQRQGKAQTVVLEQGEAVGGNAGSFELDGIPVDYGSHRLHPACAPHILRDLRQLLGDDLLDRPRHGRIRLRGRWIAFPLRPLDLALHLPWSFAAGVLTDGMRRSRRTEPAGAASFASELQRGLGATMCRDFYFPYALKIWGVPPEEISPIQAQRRVSAGSLQKLLRRALALVPGLRSPGAGRFYYPRRGYGQISDALANAARGSGAEVRLRTKVRAVHLGSPCGVEVERDGGAESIEVDHVWSTIPIAVLTRLLSPAAPPDVLEAARHIELRAMVLVYLVVGQAQFTPFDAHYFPAADVPVTRLSEPKNYAARHAPSDRTVLCAELPCTVGDEVWAASEEALAALVRQALARCDLPLSAPVRQVVVRRLPAAYPIYRRGYERHFARLDEWTGTLDRVLTFGRQGLFAHDNTHHTLAMAYGAVDCLDGHGNFDRGRWQRYRTEFDAHVVED